MANGGDWVVLDFKDGPICVNDLDEPYRSHLKNFEKMEAELKRLKEALDREAKNVEMHYNNGVMAERERIAKELALRHRPGRTMLSCDFIKDVLGRDENGDLL